MNGSSSCSSSLDYSSERAIRHGRHDLLFLVPEELYWEHIYHWLKVKRDVAKDVLRMVN